MNAVLSAALQPLLGVLAEDRSAELILRGGADDVTATLRVAGAAPRVFAVVDGAMIPQLPQHDTALAGHVLLGDLETAKQALREHVGEVRSLRLVAWRTGRRAVLRAELADGSVVWLKSFDRKGYRRAAAAFAALRGAALGVRLCLPHAELPALATFVFASAPGVALRDLAVEADGSSLRTVGAALAGLAVGRVVGELPTIDFEACRRASLGMLEKASPVRSDLLDLVPALAHLAAPATPERAGLVHGDLHDKQIFLADDTVSLIDLEGVGFGDPRFDHANLAEHLRLRDLQQHERDSGRAERMLAAIGIAPDADGLREFRAVVRARICAVYALRPRWSRLVDRLHAETRELLQRS